MHARHPTQRAAKQMHSRPKIFLCATRWDERLARALVDAVPCEVARNFS